jgi:heme-degrading monooxygenase HmoA
MFAQATAIRVPVGAMAQMRRLIEQDYLPQLRQRDGFVSAQLLEQVDDPEAALLIVMWDSQRAVEAFHRTGALQATVNALSSQMPGVRVHRDSFTVTVAAQAAEKLASV